MAIARKHAVPQSRNEHQRLTSDRYSQEEVASASSSSAAINSLKHIQQGRQLGITDNPSLWYVLIYHQGCGYWKRQTTSVLKRRSATEGFTSEDLIIAINRQLNTKDVTEIAVPTAAQENPSDTKPPSQL